MAERNQSIWERIRNTFSPAIEPDYLKGQPNEIAFFMMNFRPENQKQEALYQLMKKRLENGETTLDAEHNTLAKIGDVSMLRYLYREYESKDYHIRKLVLENPACPKDVAIKACEDHDWEVRKTALMREDVSNEVRREVALREENPFVQATLKEQLCDLYPSKAEKNIVQTVMASASLAKVKPSLASRIQAAERTITIPVPANGRPTIPKNKSPEHVR